MRVVADEAGVIIVRASSGSNGVGDGRLSAAFGGGGIMNVEDVIEELLTGLRDKVILTSDWSILFNTDH